MDESGRRGGSVQDKKQSPWQGKDFPWLSCQMSEGEAEKFAPQEGTTVRVCFFLSQQPLMLHPTLLQRGP